VYGDQACSEGIWDNAISYGLKRCFESTGCAMGARTQEENDLSINNYEEGIWGIIPIEKVDHHAQRI
jgi:hypothetical protein